VLKLAYDFTRRAVTTWRGQPIVEASELQACSWQTDDLAPGLSAVVQSNELDRLSASVLQRADNYKHSRGRGFQDHLQGVAGLLMRWQQAPLTIQTGLFHSAYSTQQYPYGLYSYAQRHELQALIGIDGERLVFLFCSHDRVDLYAQALALVRAGETLSSVGLRLRNALTGESAQVPGDLIAQLLVVHAADLAEQMDGFDFEMIAALLAAAGPQTQAPACLQLLKDAGFASRAPTIAIKPERGTFGLAPVLGLRRSLLADRFALNRLLRGTGQLTQAQNQALEELDQRLPGLPEVPWIRWLRATGQNGPGGAEAEGLLAEVQRRYAAWGITWLKRPFDGNERWECLISG